jgi:hypothetical protein
MSDRLTETLVCTFSTGDEWRAAGMDERGTGCADCHMPPVARPLVEGGEVKPGHRHTWFGAGIAKRSADLTAVRDGYLPGYDVDIGAHRTQGPPNDIAIRVAITNGRAGHELPTGDPERFVTLEVAVLDDHGTRLWTETARIGETWEWYPRARLLSDNSLKPGERRELTFNVQEPAGIDDPLTIELVVRNHRMTEENARAMGILGQYPLAVETVRRQVPVGEAR